MLNLDALYIGSYTTFQDEIRHPPKGHPSLPWHCFHHPKCVHQLSTAHSAKSNVCTMYYTFYYKYTCTCVCALACVCLFFFYIVVHIIHVKLPACKTNYAAAFISSTKVIYVTLLTRLVTMLIWFPACFPPCCKL